MTDGRVRVTASSRVQSAAFVPETDCDPPQTPGARALAGHRSIGSKWQVGACVAFAATHLRLAVRRQPVRADLSIEVRRLLCGSRTAEPMRIHLSHLVQSLTELGFEIHRGQPLVLAFAERIELRESPLLDRVRAELRGLGAALFLVWDNHIFSFRPDDELDQIGNQREAPRHTIEQLRHACGVPSNVRQLTIAIAGGDGGLLARHAISAEDGLAALAEGLTAAGKKSLEARFSPQLSRREVVLASLVGAFALLAAEGCRHASPAPHEVAASPIARSAQTHKITLNVNGVAHELEVEPRVSLLDALRERLGLTGSKKGCDAGQCGACTVLVGGRRVNACLTLAIMVGDAPVVTIEGLAEGDTLHPMQAAFIAEDALQCGYCTPGQIVSALGLVRENRARTDEEVREHMSGNICRCGAYTNIVAAIQRARAASLG